MTRGTLQVMKKSEMKPDTVYLLCPDETCGSFFDPTKPVFPCESDCPEQDELVKIVFCSLCEDIVELPGDHPTGGNRFNFNCPGEHNPTIIRDDVYYQLIYEKPT